MVIGIGVFNQDKLEDLDGMAAECTRRRLMSFGSGMIFILLGMNPRISDSSLSDLTVERWPTWCLCANETENEIPLTYSRIG
jgi:hypothetical protein